MGGTNLELLRCVESQDTSSDLEDTTSTKERILHPIQELLIKAGLDAAHFPHLRFTIKVPELDIRMNPFHMALSHKDFAGEAFESIIRTVRVLESRNEFGVKEFFLEIEWNFQNESILSDYLHPAFGLIAAEVTCPTCRHNFKCQPQILNPKTIQINCPTCRHSWNISAQEDAKNKKVGSLILDLREKEEATLQMIKQWSNRSDIANDKKYDSYFPFEFDPPMTEENPIWATKSLGINLDTESLLTAFTNQIVLHSLQIRKEEDAKTPAVIKEFHANEVTQKPEAISEKKQAQKNRKTSKLRTGILALILLIVASFAADHFFNKSKSLYISQTHLELPKEQPAEPAAIEAPTALQNITIDKELNKIEAQEKKPKKLRSALTDSIKTSDSESEVRRLYRNAQLNFKLKHFPEAIKTLEEILQKDPSLSAVYRDLGFAYLMNEEEKKSILAFKSYLKFFPASEERSEIEEFIKSLEDQKSSEALSEHLLGEKWSSLKQRATQLRSD